MDWRFEPVERTYSDRDAILYALGLGLGQDPLDEMQLRFVYEQGLEALPTMGVVLGHPGSWLADPRTGVDYRRVVHGEQHIEALGSLPPNGTVTCRNCVEEVIDKGAAKGALVTVSRIIEDTATGALLSRQRSVLFARGNGGFGGHSQSRFDALPSCPETAPDFTFEWTTHGSQALIYRLSGDMNPLHADPRLAATVGFKAPILHGLASFGIAGFAALKTFCGGSPAKLLSLGVRLSAPVYPGETFQIDFWRTSAGRGAFCARVKERDVVVLNNGVVTWSE